MRHKKATFRNFRAMQFSRKVKLEAGIDYDAYNAK